MRFRPLLPPIPVVFFCGLALTDCAAAQDRHAPQDPIGVQGQSFSSSFDPAAPSRLAAAWADWKGSWITTSGAGGGARVLFQDGSQKPADPAESTVSEGIGYGMLLAVYFDDRPLFDALNQYFAAHKNAHGLMGWKVLADGSFDSSVGGSSSATDADEDMAAALVLASAKWSAPSYQDQARDLATAILTYDVDSSGGREGASPTYSILGGDWNTSAPIDFNPSYFAPAWYRLFHHVTGDARWGAVVDEGYKVLALAADPTTGLVPQDRHIDGSSFNGQDDYEYNAFRTPFRLAVDQAWFNESRARDRVSAIARFYAGVLNTDHSNLYETHVYASRKTDGTVLGAYESGSFTSTACVALLQSGDSSNGRYLYDALWTKPGRADDMHNYYYDGAWHLFGALFASGNFDDFTAGQAGADAGGVSDGGADASLGDRDGGGGTSSDGAASDADAPARGGPGAVRGSASPPGVASSGCALVATGRASSSAPLAAALLLAWALVRRIRARRAALSVLDATAGKAGPCVGK